MSSLSFSMTAGRVSLPRWLPLLLVVVLAIALRTIATPNLDVSWCLTMAEKVLGGERLYVDIIEVNPPATVFLYVVPALLGRLSGVPAGFFVDALVFLAVGLSLWLAGRILRRDGMLGDNGWALAIAAGIGGGITAIVKPHFAAAIVCTAAAAALYARSWRPVFALENWIAALSLAAYAGLVALAYPQFVSDIIPTVLAVYVPTRTPLPMMLIGVSVPIWFAVVALTALIKRRAALAPPTSLLLAASAGFLIAFLVQQKGWAYQAYPMLALASMALALAVVEQWRRQPMRAVASRPARLAGVLAASLIVGLTFSWMNVMRIDPTAVAAAVRLIKPHPKIMGLTSFLWTGFPVTRMVEGRWVGRFSFLWITAGAWYRREHETLDPATARRLDAYMARDKAMFAADLARHRPDVILVDRWRPRTDWMAWANSYPPLAAEMRRYSPYRSVEGIDILRRLPDR